MRVSIQDKLDLDAVSQAILSAKRGDKSGSQISAAAKEMALHLVQGWIERYADADYSGPRILGVELPFYIWADDETLIAGVQDRVTAEMSPDGFPIMGGEWKTKAAPTSKRYGEDRWLEDMHTGVQLGTYALGLREGYYVTASGPGTESGPVHGISLIREYNPSAPIRIQVRAALKQIPPKFYPTLESNAVFSFTQQDTDSIKHAYINRGRMIRALTSNNIVIPWAATGKHCFNQYGKICPFLEKYCKPKKHPGGLFGIMLPDGDPGNIAAEYALRGLSEERLRRIVVISASQYETGSLCLEKLRIESSDIDHREKDQALDIGTGFHTGVAAVNRELARLQRERDNS